MFFFNMEDFVMAKNEVAKRGNSSPAYSQKDSGSVEAASVTDTHTETFEPGKTTIQDTHSETVISIRGTSKRK